jgi:hypothetical protein
MSHHSPRPNGCVEDHPALLLQLPVRLHSAHLLPPSAHVLHLPSNHFHHCELDHHILLVDLDTAAPSVVVVFVSRSVLAFSLATCWKLCCLAKAASHDQAPSNHLEDDEQRHLALLVWSVQSSAECLHRSEHLCISVQLVHVDWSICVSLPRS